VGEDYRHFRSIDPPIEAGHFRVDQNSSATFRAETGLLWIGSFARWARGQFMMDKEPCKNFPGHVLNLLARSL
jgi:hypothetical protein